MTPRAELRLAHVVGSRPQFPKLAAVCRAVQASGTRVDERIVHTGQHYDPELSGVFFDQLGIRAPDYELGVGSGDHAFQTARAIEGIAGVLRDWRPDVVVVYGDTNATLAGALASAQAGIDAAHVEAGVRTGNLRHAEELNRVVADRVCALRYCCTERDVRTLAAEGLADGTVLSGDPMLDNYLYFRPRMNRDVLARLDLDAGEYVLCTLHRAENTDAPERLGSILDAIACVQAELRPVALPLHPRTRKAIGALGREGELERAGVRVTEPVGFLELVALLEHAHCALSDSGGLQREAYFAGRRCVVPWEYAVWPDLAETGWALPGPVGARAIVERVTSAPGPEDPQPRGLFGDGRAGERIVASLLASRK